MDNFLKKLARFSLRHPYAGRIEVYPWIIVIICVATLLATKKMIDFSSWSFNSTYIYVVCVLGFLVVSFVFLMFLTTFIDNMKSRLPEVVTPQAHEIWYDNPQYRRIIDRLIRIATNDDDANLLRQWISFFGQKKSAEERMASFEMQFLSKG